MDTNCITSPWTEITSRKGTTPYTPDPACRNYSGNRDANHQGEGPLSPLQARDTMAPFIRSVHSEEPGWTYHQQWTPRSAYSALLQPPRLEPP